MKETQQKGGSTQQQPGSQNISQYLKGANFPADRDELQRTAKRNGAPSDLVDRINRLPNQRFNTENDVTNAFNQGGLSGGQAGQSGGQPGQSGGQGGPSRTGQGGGQSGQSGASRNVGQGGQTGGTQGKTTER